MLLSLLVVYAALLFTPTLAACGGTFYQKVGTISSLSDSIPYNALCEWRIFARQSERIVLNISNLDIPKSPNCDLGALEVRDGLWNTSPLLGRYCGYGPLDPLISKGHQILISFLGQNQNNPRVVASYESLCGRSVFVQSSTTLKSHESGSLYPLNTKCVWIIVVPEPAQVRLDFIKFNVEYQQSCLYDSVEIIDGIQENSTSLGRLCGNQLPPRIVSSSNIITLKFVSDSSVALEGFEVNVVPELDHCSGQHGCAHFCNNRADGYVCSCRSGYQLQPDGRSCDVVCGGNITVSYGASGTISSPLYPSTYPPNTVCTWNIVGAIGTLTTLNFTHFDVEFPANQSCSTKDNLAIVSDTGSGTVYHHGTYCGNIVPRPITSKSNIVKIVFSTDSTIERTGFVIHYAQIPDSCGNFNGNCPNNCNTPLFRTRECTCPNFYQLQPNKLDCQKGICNHLISSTSGVITSLNYPQNYTNDLDCSWSFKTTPGHRIALDFSVFDVEPHISCRYDNVTIYDGATSNSPVLTTLCGYKNGTHIVSNTSQLFLSFQTDHFNTRQGFRGNFSSVCGGTLTSTREAQYIFSHDQYLLSNYDNDINCTWTVVPTSGTQTRIIIEAFDIESGFDFLQIFDGTITEGRFSNSNKPSRVFTSWNNFTIWFKTDHSVVFTGFQIKYQSI